MVQLVRFAPRSGCWLLAIAVAPRGEVVVGGAMTGSGIASLFRNPESAQLLQCDHIKSQWDSPLTGSLSGRWHMADVTWVVEVLCCICCRSAQ